MGEALTIDMHAERGRRRFVLVGHSRADASSVDDMGLERDYRQEPIAEAALEASLRRQRSCGSFTAI